MLLLVFDFTFAKEQSKTFHEQIEIGFINQENRS